MNERTRRATEALDIHSDLLRTNQEGSEAIEMVKSLLDPASDPADVRFGHAEYLYGEADGTFGGWIHQMLDRAMTYTATSELMTEVRLTMEMMEEEGIEWLPMYERMLPGPAGLMIFPYGIEFTQHYSEPLTRTKIRGKEYISDIGGGDRWFIDGFLWMRSDRVAADGWAGPPSSGVQIFPITRWRGRDADRPFRIHREYVGRPAPAWTISDMTSWAFDKPGQTEWVDPMEVHVSGEKLRDPYDQLRVDGARDRMGRGPEHIAEELRQARWFLRALAWATFRWLNDEIQVVERGDRASERRMKKERYKHPHPEHEDGDVLVIDLRLERKEAIAGGGEEPPWWRTRWTVRGHWAKRRYAIRDAMGRSVGAVRGGGAVEGETFEYRYVFIEPFVKGPEWAPLVMRDRVGVLDR